MQEEESRPQQPRCWSTCCSSAARLDAAIDVAAAHLAGHSRVGAGLSLLAELCQNAGQSDRLAQVAREHGDLVTFTAARLSSRSDA